MQVQRVSITEVTIAEVSRSVVAVVVAVLLCGRGLGDSGDEVVLLVVGWW